MSRLFSNFFVLGVDVAQQKWVNVASVEQADRKNEIVQMCWNDNEHVQVCRLLH